MENLAIATLTDHASFAFEQAYRLIQDRIPFEERSDVSHFIKTLHDAKSGKLFPDNYHMLTAASGSQIIGVITGYYISEIDSGFINTLAVSPAYAGRGIGTTIRAALRNHFTEDSQSSGKNRLCVFV